MSVLESLRQGTNTTSIRVLIGVVVAAFVVWGAKGAADNDGGAYATVNGAAVTEAEFIRAYRAQEAQRDRDLDLDEAGEAALKQAVLEQAIRNEALVQLASDLGVAVSTEELQRELVKQPAFQKDGKFDQRTYERMLSNMGYTPAKYEVERRRQLMVAKLVDLAVAAVDVSEAEIKRAWTEQNTQLVLTYVRLPDASFLADIPVSDAERDDYVAKNGEALKKQYDDAFERQFNLPKRYTISTVLVRTDTRGVDKAAARAKADALRAAAVAPGADFAAIAAASSEDLSASKGGSLGQLAADQLDPVLVSAADATQPGQVSAVVETGRGYQFLKVEAIDEAKKVAFEEARNELAVQALREQKVGEVQRAYATKLIDAWKSTGVPPRDLADAKQLSIDTTGPFSPVAGEIPQLGAIPELLASLPGAKPGDVLPAPFQAEHNVFVVQLASRTEPDPSTYEEGKALVRARLRYQRQMEFVDGWTKDVVARADVEQRVSFAPRPSGK